MVARAQSGRGLKISSWTPSNVGSWLREVGLEKFATKFEEEASVDGETLELLDKDHLTHLGLGFTDQVKFQAHLKKAQEAEANGAPKKRARRTPGERGEEENEQELIQLPSPSSPENK